MGNRENIVGTSLWIRLVGIGLLVVAGFSGSACSSLSTLENLTATQETREELLGPRLNKFNRALYWGSFGDAALYTVRSFRREFLRNMKERVRNEKLVELNVEDIHYNDESDEAEVEMEIRYYAKPTYYVKTRKETQTWKYYRMDGGWLCKDIEISEDGSTATPPRTPSLAESGARVGSY